jgi:hypothetical protein
MKKQPIFLLFSLLLALPFSACERRGNVQKTSPKVRSTGSSSPAKKKKVKKKAKKPKKGAARTTPRKKAKALSSKGIARIVFVDLKKCCLCTRRRIHASWKNLQQALGPKNTLPLVRIHADSQADQAAIYNKKKTFMALPAIYFLNKKGQVQSLLQGQVSLAQIRGALR